MNKETEQKIRERFVGVAIYKDPQATDSIFSGRGLPSFVKDFLLKRYLNDTQVDREALTAFLDNVVPKNDKSVKDRLGQGEEVVLLTRFMVYIDLVKGLRRFAIPDMGLKMGEGQIPEYVYSKHRGELADGEQWGIIKLCVLPDDDGKRSHVEMVDYKPFKPFRSVGLDVWREARRAFGTEEWIDLLLSAMEYEPEGFEGLTQKMEFLTRLLIFIEPRLNVIELAPKGTGKSYVFGNLSKYGWLVSGGKVSRAKLFYDKARQTSGIMKNHDFAAFDEIQTIVFQEPAEIQAAMKSFLESGKTTIDNYEFSSECGLMLMGNIPLTADRRPLSRYYFNSLPPNFRESALLDRFHCFIEGWHLPRVNERMIYRGWTLNTEYFSEIMHALRTANSYGAIYDQIIEKQGNADTRDSKAVKRTATAYMKLLFPHWTSPADVDPEEMKTYCLEPAIRRRAVIKEQLSLADPEYQPTMPAFGLLAHFV